ncbi:hypothetical protein Tco_0783462 [Tanacetum coccineum]
MATKITGHGDIIHGETILQSLSVEAEARKTLELGLVYLFETTIMSTMDLDGVTCLNCTGEDSKKQRILELKRMKYDETDFDIQYAVSSIKEDHGVSEHALQQETLQR